jgi:hypothetical protein
MRITCAIMAHPSRHESAQALYNQLHDMPFMTVSIVYDKINDEWDTGKRSLQAGAGWGDWHLVLQDDAILTPDFYENICNAIRLVPEKVAISLYTGTVKPMPDRIQAAVDKAYFATWLRGYMLFWGVGVLLPSDQIKPLLEYAEGREELYDTRIGYFYYQNKLPIYYTMPSLVDHDDDIASIVGTDAEAPRRAHRLAEGRITFNDQVIDI